MSSAITPEQTTNTNAAAEQAITCEAGTAWATTTGASRGVDVSFTLTVDGSEIEGECTLAPARYDGRMVALSSCPDLWVSGAALGRLRNLPDATFRAALEAVESACSPMAQDAAS